MQTVNLAPNATVKDLAEQLKHQREALTDEKFKDKLNNKDWFPCAYCRGTGQRYSIAPNIPMSAEFLPCGDCTGGMWPRAVFESWFVNAVKLSEERQKREVRQEELVLSLKTWWKEQGFTNADWNLLRNRAEQLRGHNKYYPENW